MARRKGRRRSYRRSRKGSTGPKGLLGRFVYTATHRPLKIVAAGLGIGATAEVLLSGSSTGDGVNMAGHFAMAYQSGTAPAYANQALDVSNNVQAAIRDIGAGALSGTWVPLAAGAIITGYISRKFRI